MGEVVERRLNEIKVYGVEVYWSGVNRGILIVDFLEEIEIMGVDEVVFV